MRKYAKIRVPAEVKAELQKRKGNQTWGNYLLDLCNQTVIDTKIINNDLD